MNTCPICHSSFRSALGLSSHRGQILTCRPTLRERFDGHVQRSPGCWTWTGGRTSKGYGQLGIGTTKRLVHRLAWEMANGPIPVDLMVLHSCDNPPCVRPDHLFLGTGFDNMRDATSKGRQVWQRSPERLARGERIGASRLTAASVVDIRLRRAQGETYQAIASDFGVTVGAVRHIVIGRTWRHVE